MVRLYVALGCILGGAMVAAAEEDPPEGEAAPYVSQVVPFLQKHCSKCHGSETAEGELSFERFRETPRMREEYEVWQNVVKMLTEREMPPKDEPQPAPELVRGVIRTIEAEMARFDCRDEKKQPGRVTIRRLNRVEYNNTVRDLVGIDFQPANDFPSDDVGHGFDNIGDVLSLPPILFEKYLAAAERIVEWGFRDPVARQRLVPAPLEATAPLTEDVLRKNLTAFGRRAFRRPLREDEIARLMGIIQLVWQPGGKGDAPAANEAGEGTGSRRADDVAWEGYRAALVALLSSPHFLFRVEADPPPEDPDGIRPLDDHELATRLSYFLWSTMPDDELFRLADRGELRNAATVQAQVDRMLAHEKSRSLVENFAGQWLQLRDLKNMTPDPERFPEFDEELRGAMQRETEMFFQAVVRENRSILEFLNADFTYVNERLARHYGMAGVAGNEFRRVVAAEQRTGVLTQASILLLTSNPTRTSPVKRGKWILENILGDPPPPPPPAVEELNEDSELLGTLRERMEQHREKESCAVCHRQMDALGFGLENFDGIGAWRERDGRAEIDASGTLPGGESFRGPKQLMTILATRKTSNFSRCLAEKLLIYALGRGLQSSDRCAVDRILEHLREHDYRFGALVGAIVQSDPFLYREAPRGE